MKPISRVAERAHSPASGTATASWPTAGSTTRFLRYSPWRTATLPTPTPGASTCVSPSTCAGTNSYPAWPAPRVGKTCTRRHQACWWWVWGGQRQSGTKGGARLVGLEFSVGRGHGVSWGGLKNSLRRRRWAGELVTSNVEDGLPVWYLQSGCPTGGSDGWFRPGCLTSCSRDGALENRGRSRCPHFGDCIEVLRQWTKPFSG
jgi:hypothetical protein